MRDRLLESARAVSEAGVNSVGLEQIARHAGVTRGAVHWHLADKTDLFLAMVRDLAWRLRDLPDLARVSFSVSDADTLPRNSAGGVLAAHFALRRAAPGAR